jgi:hypothetical protein
MVFAFAFCFALGPRVSRPHTLSAKRDQIEMKRPNRYPDWPIRLFTFAFFLSSPLHFASRLWFGLSF